MSREQKPVRKKNFFDQVLEQTFDSVKPEEGVSTIKIDPYSVGHIPGMMEHWQYEIRQRKEEILEFESRNCFERLVDLFTGDEEFDDASGDELYDVHPSRGAEKLMEKIEEDPSDMMSRLELVSYIGQSGREFSLEVYRDLFLQATVACCFGELSNVGLRIVLWTQGTYFSKYLSKCKQTQDRLESFLNQPNEDNVYSKQRKGLLENLNKVKRNQKLLKFYQNFTNRGIQNLPTSMLISVSLEEIQQIVSGKKSYNAQEKVQLYKKIYPLLSALGFLPLLHNEALPYIEWLGKIDPQHPIPDFFGARLKRSQLILLIQQYKAGEAKPEMVKPIQSAFNAAYQAYSHAVRKIGEGANASEETTILVEYADLVYDFYQFATNKGIELPKDWLLKAFTKTEKSLKQAQSTRDAEELLPKIQEILAELT